MSGPNPDTRLVGRVITLAPLMGEHAEVTLAWRKSERARHLNRGAQTVEQQRQWIAASAERGDQNFIMLLGDRPVGMIALHDLSRAHRHIVMGRFLIGDADAVGSKPAAYEAELLISDYAFDTLGMHKIYGDVVEENVAMLRWRHYLGYHREGVLREHYNFDGRFVNTVMVSLLEDEYRRKCRPRLEGLITAALRASLSRD